MDGFINVLKPPGLTSNQIVTRMRKILRLRKIGHSGTLDPGAAGVLVLGVNKGTRLLEYLLESDKSYRAEITFGIKTSSADAFGSILEKKPTPKFDEKTLVKVLNSFIGTYTQLPPMTSAIKHQGKKLYEFARVGQTIERTPREVSIKDFQLLTLSHEGNFSKALFDVTCSKGTYIRTLCEDIASRLNSVAHMSFLVRTQIGSFSIEKASTLEEIDEVYQKNNTDFLLPLETVIDHADFFVYTLSETEQHQVLNGVAIETNHPLPRQRIALISSQKKMVAVGEAMDTKIRIKKVFK